MNQTGVRFSILGIPVEIKPAFLILAVLLYSMVGAFDKTIELLLWAFTALMVHELGHALAFRRFGLFPRIELHMLGGAAIVTAGEHARLTNTQKLWVSFSGPLASVLLGVVFWGIAAGLGGMPHLFLSEQEAFIFPLFFTFGWGILNMLPVLPLDGGHVMQYLLAYNPRWNAERIAAYIGVGIASLLLVYVLMNFSLWNLMLVAMLLSHNVMRLRQQGPATFVPAAKVPKTNTTRTEIEALQEKFDLGFNEDALQMAHKLLAKTNNKKHRAIALRIAGQTYLKLGRLDEAEVFAGTYPDFEAHVPELKVTLMRYQGASKAAAAFAASTYPQQPSLELAQAYLLLLAQTGQTETLRHFLAKEVSSSHSLEAQIYTVQTLLKEKQYPEAQFQAETLFAKHQQGKYAYWVALAYAGEQQAAKTLEWLDRARDKGYDLSPQLAEEASLDFLREETAFQRFRAR
jgi:Zn-dependent protease